MDAPVARRAGRHPFRFVRQPVAISAALMVTFGAERAADFTIRMRGEKCVSLFAVGAVAGALLDADTL